MAAAFLPHRIVRGDRIPAARYYDETFFQLEKDRLWPRVWQFAARLDQIPEVGDWTEYQLFEKSVLIVHTRTGIKAYHNACRHRGVRLGKGHGNCKKTGFICPFHAWRWNMEGENTFVYGRHLFASDALNAEDLRLPEVRSEVWGGCVFINFDNDAISYRDTMGPSAEHFDRQNVTDLKAEWWYATVLPANWKLAMEAFMEGYHVLRTHPQLHAACTVMYNSLYGSDTGGLGLPVNPDMSTRENVASHIRHLEVLNEGMAGMIHAKEVEIAKSLADVDLPDDPQEGVMTWYGIFNAEVTRRLREKGEDVPDLNAAAMSHPVRPIEFLFPHFFLLPVASSMASYRIRPLTSETCLFEIWSLTHFPKDSDHIAPKEPTVIAWDSKEFPLVPQQDYANIPEQQIGLHADGFEFMRLGEKIEGLIGNYQRIIDGYLEGASTDQLAKAIHMLCNNFDGPLLDLGIGAAREVGSDAPEG